MTTVSYTEFRKSLAKYLDMVQENLEKVVITRGKGRKAVLVSHDEYSSMMETLYLLSSKKNREHLEESIKDYKEGRIVEIDLDSL